MYDVAVIGLAHRDLGRLGACSGRKISIVMFLLIICGEFCEHNIDHVCVDI